MKRSVKPTRERAAKRDLFAELNEGMNALAEARHGKRTLVLKQAARRAASVDPISALRAE